MDVPMQSRVTFEISLKQQMDIVPLTCSIEPGLHLRNGRSEDRKSCGILPLVMFSVFGISWQTSS